VLCGLKDTDEVSFGAPQVCCWLALVDRKSPDKAVHVRVNSLRVQQRPGRHRANHVSRSSGPTLLITSSSTAKLSQGT
jgi:hypothetical protein